MYTFIVMKQFFVSILQYVSLKKNRHYFLPSIICQLKCVHQVKKTRLWENRKEFPFIIVCTSSKRFVYTVLIPGIFVSILVLVINIFFLSPFPSLSDLQQKTWLLYTDVHLSLGHLTKT